MNSLPASGVAPLEAARLYRARGWAVIPIPVRSKNPGIEGWQLMRLADEDLPHHFNGHPQNIGVLLGEPSHGIVDVDLDHPLAVEMAAQFLPETPALFGRAGKQCSHWVYRCTGPIETKRFRSRNEGTLVEIRSSGAQTVFPPSTHPSGESIEWIRVDAEPAAVAPQQIADAVDRLVLAVKAKLGEAKADPFDRCLNKLRRIKIKDTNDGSRRLFAAACRCVEAGLDDERAVACIRQLEMERPFPRAWGDDEIRTRLDDARKKIVERPRRDDGLLRQILIDVDEHRVADEAIAALAGEPDLYQRGGLLVRVVSIAGSSAGVEDSASTWTVQRVPSANIRDRLTRRAALTKISNKGEEVSAHPPPWLVPAIEGRHEWPGVRVLSGVASAPVLLPDGTLLQQPGYHDPSGVLYIPSGEYPAIRENVGLEDARRALDELFEVVADFPFETPAHRAAWVAALLTPIARHAFEGPSPLFLIDANIRGAGKGMLAKIIGCIALGGELAVSTYSKDEDEMRKRITALALRAERIVLLDNIEGVLGNAALDRALTTTKWQDRVLGKSNEVSLPLTPTWLATGNNVAIGADTLRRTIHIRLEVLEEQPENRTGFRHPDLMRWVASARRRLYAAAATILVAFCRSGRPRAGVKPFGSFEGWSDLVRHAVIWAGMPDPCDTRQELAAGADTALEQLDLLMVAVARYDPHGRGVVVSEMIRNLFPTTGVPPADYDAVTARAALEEVAGCPPGRTPNPRIIGNRLKALKRRVRGGLFLDIDASAGRRAGAVWRLFRVEADAAHPEGSE